jgi:hypothetical protein
VDAPRIIQKCYTSIVEVGRPQSSANDHCDSNDCTIPEHFRARDARVLSKAARRSGIILFGSSGRQSLMTASEIRAYTNTCALRPTMKHKNI